MRSVWARRHDLAAAEAARNRHRAECSFVPTLMTFAPNRLRRSGTVLLLGISLHAAQGRAQAPQGEHRSSRSATLPSCDDVDRSDEQVDAAAVRAQERLKRRGIVVNDLNSPHFMRYMDEMAKELGCRLPRAPR